LGSKTKAWRQNGKGLKTVLLGSGGIACIRRLWRSLFSQVFFKFDLNPRMDQKLSEMKLLKVILDFYGYEKSRNWYTKIIQKFCNKRKWIQNMRKWTINLKNQIKKIFKVIKKSGNGSKIWGNRSTNWDF